MVINNKNVQYAKGDVVYKAGTACTKFVIVLEGSLINEGENKVVVEKGQMYGEEFLMSSNQKTTYV